MNKAGKVTTWKIIAKLFRHCHKDIQTLPRKTKWLTRGQTKMSNANMGCTLRNTVLGNKKNNLSIHNR